MRTVTLTTLLCLFIAGCYPGLNTNVERDMRWFHEHNGYAMMTIVDMNNQPVMEVVGIPLNSEAMWELVHDEIADAEVHAQLRIKRQRPVMYLTVHAYRECLFTWPSVVLTQGQSKVYPTKAFPAQSKYLAAVGRLYKQYGVERVDSVHGNLGLFVNPYTGQDVLELGKEIELGEGASLSAIVSFGGGLDLSIPFRLVCSGRRCVLLSGDVYTTREAGRRIRIYVPPGQDLPGENIYRRSYTTMDGKAKRERIEK